MAAALHFCGIKRTHSIVSRDSLQLRPLPLQQLRFSSSVPWSILSCRTSNACRSSRVFKVSCEAIKVDVAQKNEPSNSGSNRTQLSCVMKFGGSSVASAERMREVADLILSFPNERPVIVLSAMGKTTNKLLLVRNFLCYCLSPALLSHCFTEFDPCVVGRRKGSELWFYKCALY